MYKLLVVDDEMIERSGIKFLIGRMGLDIETVEAANGQIALKYLKENDVDILLTDIKMPFMDGIELVTQITKNHFHMKMIIISGFGEFEYAKKAMSMGVSNYILKPVDPSEFEKTIKEVLAEIDKERSESQIVEAGLLNIKRYMLVHLLNGESPEYIESRTDGAVSLDFINSFRKAVVLETDGDFSGEDKDISEYAESIINKKFFTLNDTAQQIVMFFDCDPITVSWSEFGRKMAEFLTRKYGRKCYVGISDNINGIDDLKNKCDDIEQIMESRFYDTGRQLYLGVSELAEDTAKDTKDVTNVSDNEILEIIEHDLNSGDIDGAKNHVEKLCEKYHKDAQYSQIYVKFIFSNIYKLIFKLEPNNDEKKLNTKIEELYRQNDFVCIERIIMEALEQIEKDTMKENVGQNRDIETVKQFISKHYGENISINQLAEVVCMAPSYLSHLFKKETGQNLVKYIKSVRMHKAKKMLSETHEKIVDISEFVGYPNVSYFCQSFREYYGISPQKYRNQGDTDETI